MQGVWLENRSIQFVSNLNVPEVNQGEALVRVRLAGICGTDLQMLQGYYPFRGIPGHEFVGDVVESPKNPAMVGSRVVGSINIGCGDCDLCLAGLNNHCRQRQVLGIRNHDGAFAEYLTLPLSNLYQVKDSISDDEAVFAEPIAAALQILHQVDIGTEDSVLVIGAGRLGQLIAQVLQTTGCQLSVVARHRNQSQLLHDRDIHTIAETELPQATATIAIDASGSPSGLAAAQQAIRPKGTIVVKSTYKGKTEFDFSKIVVDEINLVGSRCGIFPPALELLEKQRIDPKPLIDARYHFHQAAQAFEHAQQPGTMKILLQP